MTVLAFFMKVSNTQLSFIKWALEYNYRFLDICQKRPSSSQYSSLELQQKFHLYDDYEAIFLDHYYVSILSETQSQLIFKNYQIPK